MRPRNGSGPAGASTLCGARKDALEARQRRAVKATTVSEPPGAVNARRLKRCASKELHR
jgi:hypothetical protein